MSSRAAAFAVVALMASAAYALPAASSDDSLAAAIEKIAAAVKVAPKAEQAAPASSSSPARQSVAEPAQSTGGGGGDGGAFADQSSLPLGYNEWASLYVKRLPDGRAYVHYNQDGVSKPLDAVAVSESVGFGMLASVLGGPKSDFDAFLKFYESFKNQRSGMMGWQIVDRDGKLQFNLEKFAYGNDSATDGDTDAAVALVYASQRWGDKTYLEKGKAVGKKLVEWTLNPDSGLPNLGDWVARTPDEEQDRGYGPKKFHYVSRPSDFTAAAAFAVLEKAGAGDPKAWARARTQGLTSLNNLLDQAALPPDFTVWDPVAKKAMRPPRGVVLLEKFTDSEYSWNSCRVPWRVAARIAQDPNDNAAQVAGRKLAAFFSNVQKGQLKAGYRLPEMTPLETYEAVAFSGPAWALMKVLGDNAKAAEYAEDVKRLRGYGGLAKSYYGDSALLLAGLQLQKYPWMK